MYHNFVWHLQAEFTEGTVCTQQDFVSEVQQIIEVGFSLALLYKLRLDIRQYTPSQSIILMAVA